MMPETAFFSLVPSILAQRHLLIAISSLGQGLVTESGAVCSGVVASSLGHMVHHNHQEHCTTQ